MILKLQVYLETKLEKCFRKQKGRRQSFDPAAHYDQRGAWPRASRPTQLARCVSAPTHLQKSPQSNKLLRGTMHTIAEETRFAPTTQ